MTSMPSPLDGINNGTAVSCLCPRDSQLRLGMDACALILGDDDAQICMPPPQEVFTPPQDAVCCIVSLREFRLTFGMNDLIGYHTSGAPGHLFRMGFFAEVTLSFAHSRGFSNLLRRAHSISAESLFPLLKSELRPHIISAICEVLGDQPVDYQDILSARAALQACIEKTLFWQLYKYGLCIKPHSLSIQGFSKPIL